MILHLKDAPEKAHLILSQLVDLFKEKKINPSPLNYYVWYAYFKGDQLKLRQEMDHILEDPFGYTDRLGIRLYQDYLQEDDPHDHEFDRAFKRLVQLMIQKMQAWTDRFSHHSETINHCQNSFNNAQNMDSQSLKNLTETMLHTANDMQKSSEEFQQELMASNQEIIKLQQELRQAQAASMMDELTEIGNRKAFNMALDELTEQAKDTPERLHLILTDIDHFKQFNDKFGHLVGDSVLRYFSNLMKKSQQENEVLCRFGGEEFILILKGTTQEQALARAEQIRQDLANAKLRRKDSETTLGKITASFGVATYLGPDKETLDDFIKRADDALYQAKNSGRNRVLYSPLKEELSDSKASETSGQ